MNGEPRVHFTYDVSLGNIVSWGLMIAMAGVLYQTINSTVSEHERRLASIEIELKESVKRRIDYTDWKARVDEGIKTLPEIRNDIQDIRNDIRAAIVNKKEGRLEEAPERVLPFPGGLAKGSITP